ncbi:hypothetical protein OF83DRAFT_1179634 [Amylostereum chailletii]|nr:hypothetical protein OF83DRAFT_1179634 [Amylostereum chailletii]
MSMLKDERLGDGACHWNDFGTLPYLAWLQFQMILRKELAAWRKELDILQCGRLAPELIAQAGMGYTFHVLQGENDTFAVMLKDHLSVFFPSLYHRATI